MPPNTGGMNRFEVFQRLQQSHPTVLLAFSAGKDSLACLTVLTHLGFTVKPYYLYGVPGLNFVDTYIRYIEQRFNVQIAQYPNPSFGDEVRMGWYRAALPDFPRITMPELREVIRADLGTRMIVTGQKKMDSVQRRAMISSVNAIDEKHGYAYPLAEWNDRDVHALLNMHRVNLPPDYNADSTGNFGGAITPRWCKWIKAHSPQDWQTILKYYPHAEAALLKGERENRQRRR